MCEPRLDYEIDNRASLLFVSGMEDHIMPPSVQASNAKHCTSKVVTDVKVYEGRAHRLPAEPGWQEIADYVLGWALDHARSAAR